MSDGRCLEHAYDEAKRRGLEGENVLYVQGTITNPHTGRTFKHAWVEDGVNAIDPTADLTMKKTKYYSTFNPKNVVRISPFIMILLSGRGHRFFTKTEVKAAIEKDRKLMESIIKKRKK